MSHFAVIREAGTAWADGKAALEQPGVDDHGAFMGGLADEGLVLFAGPLAGTEVDRIRVLLIADAQSEAEIRGRLANDPWELSDRLETVSVEPWTLFVGAERLAVPSAKH